MDYHPVNIAEKLSEFSDHWQPKIVAQLNDYHIKLVKFKGEFVWHKHDETDEVFLVVSGSMKILFRDGGVTLTQGELYVVPKGVEHKPEAESECQILLIEPAGLVNTGDAGGDKTAPTDVWI